MRAVLLSFAATLFLATLTASPPEAKAVTCAKGVYRAGCVGPNGAAVVRRPPAAACRYVVVNGVRVRRCV